MFPLPILDTPWGILYNLGIKERKQVADLECKNLIFISHDNADSAQALALYNLLLEAEPEWKDRIFLDCSPDRPIEPSGEWKDKMLKEADESRHLIFVTSNLNYLREGNGWVYEEVSCFQNLKATRNKYDRGYKNISYFGIFLCPCDFENALFTGHKSTEYRKLYQRPENLVLCEGETVEDATERIRNKVRNMIAGEEDDDSLQMLVLDKTKAFRDQKLQDGTMLPSKAIDNKLLPMVESDDSKLSFDGLCRLLEQTNVQLWGSEGGCGKTTLLTKLFHRYLHRCQENPEEGMIPLYVDAKNLFGKNNLLLRYLAKNLFHEHTAMTAEQTSANVTMLSSALSQEVQKPRYLLIIDGYNELPEESERIFKEEIKQFLPGGEYENVRVILSGRHISGDLSESVFAMATVQALDDTVVKEYLQQKNCQTEKMNLSLLRVLAIPMYLKMYTTTAAKSGIQTKADLLCAFLDWQQKKEKDSAVEPLQKQIYQLLLYHFLPAVAYGAVTGSHGGSSFVFTRKALESMLTDQQERLEEEEYYEYYGEEFEKQLVDTEIASMKKLYLKNLAEKYFVTVCKLLHKDQDNCFDFVHQVYRDFFCAWYIAEELRRSLEQGICSASLSKQRISGPVMEFVAELLKERGPFFDNARGCWDFSCNEKSGLVKMLDIIRKEEPDNSAVAVANVLRMLRYIRKKNLSALDLSGLDLTHTNLQRCYFAPPQRDTPYATSFAGATVNRENLFAEQHAHELLAACTNKEYLACVDSGGFLKLWKKTTEDQYPVRIITDVRYAIRELLFCPEGDKLYAMTAHEILEIPIPQDFISRAQVRVVMKTPNQLRKIALDDSGKLLFTTNMNSFNFRSVEDPDQPDKLKFYGINSAASVNTAGDRLAYGYVSGYEGLKLFDIHPDGTWKERSYGYGKLLNQYFIELEEFFRSIKLYNRFPTDCENYDKRRTYFSYMQNQLIDRTHDHNEIPRLIADRCIQTLETVGETPVTLYPNQLKKLYALAEKHACIFKEALTENGRLMQISGRKITGLQFKKGTNTLLVSSILNFQEMSKGKKGKKLKKPYDNMVLELDTDTYQTRLITRAMDIKSIRAFYCGDDIVTITRYRVTVYDSSGAVIARLRNQPNRVRNYISPPDGDTFFAISTGYVYEMDRDMRCVRGMGNMLNTTDQHYYRDEQGRQYLCRMPNEKEKAIFAVDLRTGTTCKLPLGIENLQQSQSHAAIGPMRYKTCSDKLVSYRDNIKQDEMTLPYGLYVCGCDFTGVKGGVTDPQYMQILNRMGGKTDPVTFPDVQAHISDQSFTPSEEALVIPEELPINPYAYHPRTVLRDECNFGDTVGGNELYTQKTWAMIQKGSFSNPGLEAADYSILEWVNRLRYATQSMVRDLAEAGIITQPRQYTDVGRRLTGPLHKTYKFVFRTRFLVNHNPTGELIATVEDPYGSKLLHYITNQQAENPLMMRYNGNSGRIWSVDRKHRKISIFDYASLKEIRRALALNHWFTLTARRCKEHLQDYSLNSIFDANSHFNGRANVHGYIRLGEQAFFAQAVRSFGGGEVENDIVDKVERLCILSQHYPDLECYGQQISGLNRQPVVVLICEDLAHCQRLNQEVEQIYPNVRKLFTFDALLMSEEAAQGSGNFIEFSGGTAHSVKLETLI